MVTFLFLLLSVLHSKIALARISGTNQRISILVVEWITFEVRLPLNRKRRMIFQSLLLSGLHSKELERERAQLLERISILVVEWITFEGDVISDKRSEVIYFNRCW